MNVVFLGSPSFAVPSLVSLAQHENIEVALVVTQPDRPAGRGRALTPPPVKRAAEELGLPVFQPDSLRDDLAVERVAATRPAALIVVGYGEILRRNVLDIAPAGCLNVHPSLLPRYRGAAPIQAAILNGDDRTGVSIIRLVRWLDAGPIVAQTRVDIKMDDTTGSLSERLAGVAAEMLPDIALTWVAGKLIEAPQDEDSATYTREWTTADARIDWRSSAVQIERLVRAANPWPVAWTLFNGQRLRVLAASPAGGVPRLAPGVIMAGSAGVFVGNATDALRLDIVQPPGKRPMPATDWWRGVRSAKQAFDAADE